MNPLKVRWFRLSSKRRLFRVWMVVQLCLHRQAPARIRASFIRVAGWFDTTVMSFTSSNSQQEKRDAIDAAYRKLQADMARIKHQDHRLKDEINSIKSSFFQLLDLCGINDASIPSINDPVPLNNCQQMLITNFGTMSKSRASAMSTPQRNRRRYLRRDPASYADMLIDQLMANASPDSDTSPPSAEESRLMTFIPDPNLREQEMAPSSYIQPMSLQFDDPNIQHPTTSSHRPLSPASDARCEWLDDRDNLPLPSNQHLPPHLQARVTSDSGITSSTISPPIQEKNLSSPKANPNTTSGSTPELPVSASSESLDIPFASFFDKIDNMNALSGKPLTSIIPSQIEATSEPQHQTNCYNFPLKYSHSYAKELQRLEKPDLFNEIQSEPDCLSSPKPIPKYRKSSIDKPLRSMDAQFIFQEPLVVVLPEKGLPSKMKLDGKHDYNLNNNYKPSLEDKSGVVVTADDDSPKPPIPPRVPLITTNTPHAPAVSSATTPSDAPVIPPRIPLTNSDSNNRIGQFILASGLNKDIGSIWLSHKNRQKTIDFAKDSLSSSSSENVTNSPCNMSWSYIDSPPQECPPNSLVSMSTGKAHIRGKKNAPTFVQHPPSPTGATNTTSASKRRKGNDKSCLPIDHGSNATQQPWRSARQKLCFTSPAHTDAQSPPRQSSAGDNSQTPTKPSTPLSSRMDRMRKKKRHSPAMRRLMQEKENNLLSPSKNQTSPRKPLGELYNIQLNRSDPLTTSSNSLSPSSEAYAKSSETSPDMPLPSREEDLIDRHAYYEDFTVDRDIKFGNLTPQQRQGLYRKNTQDNLYILKDPSSDELLVRQVEGAECSPKKTVFQAPLPNTRAPRSVRIKRQSRVSSCGGQIQTRSSSSGSYGRNSSPDSHAPSKYSSRSKQVSNQRQSSSSGTCSSHPMASSTLIMDQLWSPDNEEETGSVYTWSIEEGSETCNLERSFFRSQSAKKNKKKDLNPSTPRPPTSLGRDSSDISDFEELSNEKSSFEITAMVSAIDKSLNGTSVISGQHVESYYEESVTSGVISNSEHRSSYNASLPRTSTRGTISGRGILAAAPNIMKNMSKSSNSNPSEASQSQSQGLTLSFPSSTNQASTSSAAFNRAKASLQFSSDEQAEYWSDSRKDGVKLPRTLSSSAPNLAMPCFDDEEDASHSLQPSDTDSTPEYISQSSFLEERSDIPGKSNSSGSSSCTAARCRPRVTPQITSINSTNETSRLGNEATSTSSAQKILAEQPGTAAQDLMDSILTDSPKSVDSSGIFAPYNSYNSPAESVGSHNGYSSTVSSSIPSSDSYCPPRRGKQTPAPMLPIQKFNTPTSIHASDNSIFKRPFSPAPHIDRTVKPPVTRSQGVTASASCSSSPARPLSVRSDPLANKSIFAVPPGVVTGPPKISNKKSLVKKLKKFSTNFYKKNEKIQTLANL